MSSKKTTWIQCKNSSKFGIVDFFLISGNTSYYLFSNKFRQGLWKFYNNGVRYEKAIDYKKANNDHSVINAMRRLRLSISHIEKHENVYIPEKNRCRKPAIYKEVA